MSKKITEFFKTPSGGLNKRTADDAFDASCENETIASHEESSTSAKSSTSKSDQISTKPQSKKPTATLKTIAKWQKELNITLGHRMENDTVVEIWCTVCREFATDRTSTVSFDN